MLLLKPREENQQEEECDEITQKSNRERQRIKKTPLNIVTGDFWENSCDQS